jgi:hypothetical protein
MATTELTMKRAYLIQFEQLQEWGKVLNQEAYMMLVDEMLRRNAEGYNSPYDVFRGVDMDNFIHNGIMRKL